MTRPAIALTVAGSDPSGGAGVQADLKTFAAWGVYGCAVLTALTAQSTRGVAAVHDVPAAFVVRQLDVLLQDVTVDAVKVGMLGNAAVADAVLDRLVQWRRDRPAGVVVLDPVATATSGACLLDDAAVRILRDRGPEVADLVTPNLPEAALLLERSEARDVPTMREHAQALARAGWPAVLVKGGHLTTGAEPVTDVLTHRGVVRELVSPAVVTRNTHGTGCTLSSAVAASTARAVHEGAPGSRDWADHVSAARDYLTGALRAAAGWRLGSGPGPVDHSAG